MYKIKSSIGRESLSRLWLCVQGLALNKPECVIPVMRDTAMRLQGYFRRCGVYVHPFHKATKGTSTKERWWAEPACV